MDMLPPEILNIVASHLPDRQKSDWTCKEKTIARNVDWKKDVANLRLVNRYLAACCRHVLFEEVVVNIKFTIPDGQNRLFKLKDLAQSSAASHVKSLAVRFIEIYEDETDYNHYGKLFHLVKKHLPTCVKAFQNLKSLDMICQGGEDMEGLATSSFRFNICEHFNDTMAEILTDPSIGRLETLAVQSPSTYNVMSIMAYHVNESRVQQPLPATSHAALRTLSLDLTDLYDFPLGENVEAEDLIIEKFGPDARNAPDLFLLADQAPNLEHLSIKCSDDDILEHDTSDLHSMLQFRKLKSLYLENFATYGRDLLQLLECNKTTLETVRFTDIILFDGTVWPQVLAKCCEFPNLSKVAMMTTQQSEVSSQSAYLVFHDVMGNQAAAAVNKERKVAGLPKIEDKLEVEFLSCTWIFWVPSDPSVPVTAYPWKEEMDEWRESAVGR